MFILYCAAIKLTLVVKIIIIMINKCVMLYCRITEYEQI